LWFWSWFWSLAWVGLVGRLRFRSKYMLRDIIVTVHAFLSRAYSQSVLVHPNQPGQVQQPSADLPTASHPKRLPNADTQTTNIHHTRTPAARSSTNSTRIHSQAFAPWLTRRCSKLASRRPTSTRVASPSALKAAPTKLQWGSCATMAAVENAGTKAASQSLQTRARRTSRRLDKDSFRVRPLGTTSNILWGSSGKASSKLTCR
jgi:hypothetical protein